MLLENHSIDTDNEEDKLATVNKGLQTQYDELCKAYSESVDIIMNLNKKVTSLVTAVNTMQSSVNQMKLATKEIVKNYNKCMRVGGFPNISRAILDKYGLGDLA